MLKKKKQKKITSKFYFDYFEQKDIQRWLEADDLEVLILKASDEFLVVH